MLITMINISGTLREDEEMDDVSIQRLSKAFDILQEEIKRDSFQKVVKVMYI